MLFDSTIIVCQGNFEYEYHKCVVLEYKDFKNVVFSTWPEHKDFLLELGVEESKILISIKPNNLGHSNSNLQFKSSCVGVESRRNEYNFAFKIRSDLFIEKTKIVNLINLFDKTKIYFPAWHNHDGGIYVSICFLVSVIR